MEKDLLVALASGVISFFIFLKLLSYLNKIFNLEMPDFIGFLLGLVIIGMLYMKKDFFFGFNPIVTGVTIGFLLALFWDIKETGFMISIIKAVISFRFILWAALLCFGIYKNNIVTGVLNKSDMLGSAGTKGIILSLAVIVFAAGSVFMLFPEFYVRNTMKHQSFTFNKSVPTSKKIFIQFTGALLVLISSTLLAEAVAFIYAAIK